MEWKNRQQKFSIECADTMFGEGFAHAVLGHIQVNRCYEDDPENPSREVEWFRMETLTWENQIAIGSKSRFPMRVGLSHVQFFLQLNMLSKKIFIKISFH